MSRTSCHFGSPTPLNTSHKSFYPRQALPVQGVRSTAAAWCASRSPAGTSGRHAGDNLRQTAALAVAARSLENRGAVGNRGEADGECESGAERPGARLFQSGRPEDPDRGWFGTDRTLRRRCSGPALEPSAHPRRDCSPRIFLRFAPGLPGLPGSSSPHWERRCRLPLCRNPSIC